MQITHEEWSTTRKEIASTAAQHEGDQAPQNTGINGGTALVMLILLFLASLAYVTLGGTLAIEASPIPEPETSIALVPAEPRAAGGALLEQRASGGSVTPSN